VSQPVDLAALEHRIREYGTAAYLVTVNEDGSPHVVSVVVRYDGAAIRCAVGGRTRGNLARRGAATVLWGPAADPAYSMLIDVRHEAPDVEGDDVVLAPTSGVLHRVAGAAGDGPTCVALADDPGVPG
jgi:hypothetical protein